MPISTENRTLGGRTHIFLKEKCTSKDFELFIILKLAITHR